MAGTQMAVNIPSIRCPLNQRNPETKNEIKTPNNRNKSAFLNINKHPLIFTVRKNTNQTPSLNNNNSNTDNQPSNMD